MRSEVIQSTLTLLQELDVNNPTFLIDLTNTMIDVNNDTNNINIVPTIVILKRKIGKESTFGKFIRMVLLGIIKMTQSQIIYCYKQLCLYCGVAYRIKPLTSLLPPPATASTCEEQHQHQQPPFKKRLSIGKSQETVTVLDEQQQAIGEVESPAVTSMEISLSDTQIEEDEDDDEIEHMDIPLATLSSSTPMQNVSSAGLSKLVPPHPFPADDENTLDFPSSPIINTSSVGIAAEVEVKTILSTPASITKPTTMEFIFDKMEKMVPYDQILNFNSQTLTAPIPNKDTATPKYGLDIFEQLTRQRIENNLNGLGCNLYGNYNKRLEEAKIKQRLTSTTLKEKRKFSPQKEQQQQRGQQVSLVSSMELEVDKEDLTKDCNNIEIASNPKLWSRKVIESTIETIISDMNIIQRPMPRTRKYSPKQISTFVTQAKSNPNAQALLPQLVSNLVGPLMLVVVLMTDLFEMLVCILQHFLDYLSSLQIKDVSRATEALRASFDHRIKPTTSELNKGIPYAPFHFAILYDRLGYK